MEAAPVDEVLENAAMPVTPDQPGEHAAKLTPNAALVDPIGELTIDTDSETRVPSSTIRASASEAFSTNGSFTPLPQQIGYTMNQLPI